VPQRPPRYFSRLRLDLKRNASRSHHFQVVPITQDHQHEPPINQSQPQTVPNQPPEDGVRRVTAKRRLRFEPLEDRRLLATLEMGFVFYKDANGQCREP
jgi:hypothetical protein